MRHIFQNRSWILNYNLFKKKNSIVSRTAKSFRRINFRKTASPKKHLALKSSFSTNFFFFLFSKTVLVIDLTFQFRVSSLKNVEFMDKLFKFSLKISSKIMFFTHPGCYKQFCKYWRAWNFFTIWLWRLFFKWRGYRL